MENASVADLTPPHLLSCLHHFYTVPWSRRIEKEAATGGKSRPALVRHGERLKIRSVCSLCFSSSMESVWYVRLFPICLSKHLSCAALHLMVIEFHLLHVRLATGRQNRGQQLEREKWISVVRCQGFGKIGS
jgi:hypothetical protein